MKIKDGYILRKVAGVDMVVPVGNNIADFSGVITLNESAAFLWEQLTTETQAEDLASALQQRYEIDWDLAYKDTNEFIGILKEAAILE